MVGKTVPISVRFEEDESAFLASLQIGGARTVSDKLRMLVQREKLRQKQSGDYLATLQDAQDSLAKQLRIVKEGELESGEHSEIISKAFDVAPDLMAYLQYAPEMVEQGKIDREEMERKVADKLFFALEHMLRLSVTPNSRCYDRKLVNTKVNDMLDLLDLVCKSASQGR